MNEKLYEAIKKSAEEINELDKELGYYAMRKVAHISPTSPIETLIRTGEDVGLIAEMYNKKNTNG